MGRIRSGTYEAVQAQPRQNALQDIERALSDLGVCLELLGHVSRGDSQQVVRDAQRAMQRLEEWLGHRRLSTACGAQDEARQAC